MTWAPVNNQYDGVNSTPTNDVELNAPYYDWDIQYYILSPVVLYAPLLTRESAGGGVEEGEEGEELHNMRVMVVPPELGRCA